jgi:tRNA (mo5U34)-methyltransferase
MGIRRSQTPREVWHEMDNDPLLSAEEGRDASAELTAEIENEPQWMYPWRIGGRTAPLLAPELPSVHRTRRELIEPHARAALEAAGPDARALDIACSEGYFSHALLSWGASEVVAVDIRDVNIRRAKLVRDHSGIPAERLSFKQADVFDLRPEELGTFDVVLCLGLIYHLENPVGAVRVARSLTRSLCVIESQLTRQEEPIVHGFGATDILLEAEGSFATLPEQEIPAQEASKNPIASAAGVLSLIPNRAAMVQAASLAGFSQVEFAPAGPDHNPQYVVADRAVLLARP